MEFGEKKSVEEFKEMNGVETLKLIVNPQNNKEFIVGNNGKVLGAVSKNYSPDKDKEFIELIIEDGTRIWCLHNPSEENVKEKF